MGVLKDDFAGRPWSEAEENLQARVRGTLLMAYSNKFGRLVLTTGNKSESAVGYSTLYGRHGWGLCADQGRVKDRGLGAVPRDQPPRGL